MRYLLVLLPMMLCVACETVGPDESDDGHIVLSVERQSYTAGSQAVVVVENNADAPFYLYRCGGEIGLELERRDGNEWEDVWGGVNFVCTDNKEQGPFRFGAGEQKRETFSLERTGEYRLRTEYGKEADFDSYEKVAVSGTFEIVEP